MNFHILTLFPDMVMQGLSTSIIGRAMENNLLSIDAVNIRDYTTNKHNKVDDYPYGGGAGMLMQAQPVYDAWKDVAGRCTKKPRTVYLTPQGPTFTQEMAKELAHEEDIVFLCGHYEGIDERVLEEVVTDYVSIGDYVLTGGELPAMVMIDAISRMVPGVLNNEVSGVTESFEGNLLEYPQYSRPEQWKGKSVPQVLLSGNQRKIREWRLAESIERTKARRPDMYARYEKLQKCLPILKKQKLLHIGMTELIERGQAELIYEQEGAICLRDKVSDLYFLTAEEQEQGKVMLEEVKSVLMGKTIVTHQQYLLEQLQQWFGNMEATTCYQAVYTQKEKCRTTDSAVEIRSLSMEHYDVVLAHYKLIDDPEYIKERIEKGWMFGAFLENTLVGFAGMHQEGSMGMLEILPEYRGRGYGKALEIFMINLTLEMGWTPYCQVIVGNEASMNLQRSLGLYFSKGRIDFFDVPILEKLLAY